MPDKPLFILVCIICTSGIIHTLTSRNYAGILICFALITGYMIYLTLIKRKPSFLETEKDIDELIHDLKTPATAQYRVTEHLSLIHISEPTRPY